MKTKTDDRQTGTITQRELSKERVYLCEYIYILGSCARVSIRSLEQASDTVNPFFPPKMIGSSE